MNVIDASSRRGSEAGRRGVRPTGGGRQIREEASAGGVSDLAPRGPSHGDGRRAAGAPMSGPVQRSADVWRRAGAAVAGAPRELQSAPKPRRRHTPPLRVALSPAEIPIKAGGGDARYSGAGAVLTESGT